MANWVDGVVSFYTDQLPGMLIAFPILLLPFVALERWRPVRTPPNLREYGLNFAISVSTAVIATPFGVLAAHLAAALRDGALWPTVAFTFSDVGVGHAVLDPILRVLSMIFLPLFVHDLWFYWSHRLEHQIPWLWRFHRLHHSDPNMNASTYGRDHFGQSVWRAFFSSFTVGLVFDLELRDAEQAAMVSTLFLIFLSQFYHSATRIRLPWLDQLLVTPQVHRIHHSTLQVHQNKNFADAFPIFDILFGTYWRPARDEFPATGVADGAAPPKSWWRAQLEPMGIRRRAISGE